MTRKALGRGLSALLSDGMGQSDELKEIDIEYSKIKHDPEFLSELIELRKRFVGRPSPIYECKNLSDKIGGARIYLKREDLNHTGSHKINHCLGEALLAKRMGKKKLIAETGAGQHGVALATVASLFQMECEIHMGELGKYNLARC